MSALADLFSLRNHGVTYQQNTSGGKLFIKLPNISFPFGEKGKGKGELILATGNQVKDT